MKYIIYVIIVGAIIGITFGLFTSWGWNGLVPDLVLLMVIALSLVFDGFDYLYVGVWNGRKAGTYNWYEIQDSVAYWEEFLSPKIFSTKVSLKPTFSYDDEGLFSSNTSYFIPVKKDGLYLLAILNSKISYFISKHVFVGKQNNYYEVQPTALEAFPIPSPFITVIFFSMLFFLLRI